MSGELSFATDSAEETRWFGTQLGAALEGGEVLAMQGPLGVGKTTFIQGVAKGLGVEEKVTSPTFTLVHQHRGRLPLVHADVYRLDTLEEVQDLGLGGLLEEDTVLAVEWSEAIPELLPEDRLEVRIEAPEPGDRRKLILKGLGERARGALARLKSLLEARGGVPARDH